MMSSYQHLHKLNVYSVTEMWEAIFIFHSSNCTALSPNRVGLCTSPQISFCKNFGNFYFIMLKSFLMLKGIVANIRWENCHSQYQRNSEKHLYSLDKKESVNWFWHGTKER